MDNKTLTIISSIWKAITIFLLFVGLLVALSDSSGMFLVFIALIFGLSTGAIANFKGKEWGWPAVYGFTYGLLALLYYAVSPKQVPKQVKGWSSDEIKAGDERAARVGKEGK